MEKQDIWIYTLPLSYRTSLLEFFFIFNLFHGQFNSLTLHPFATNYFNCLLNKQNRRIIPNINTVNVQALSKQLQLKQNNMGSSNVRKKKKNKF